MVSRYPLDFDVPRKGDTISADILEQATGYAPGSDRYRLACLKVCKHIERAGERRGDLVTVRVIGDTIRILTDAEAATYNPKQFGNGISKTRRAHHRTAQIDASNLTEPERKKLDAHLIFQSRVLAGIALGARNRLPSPSAPALLGVNRDAGKSEE